MDAFLFYGCCFLNIPHSGLKPGFPRASDAVITVIMCGHIFLNPFLPKQYSYFAQLQRFLSHHNCADFRYAKSKPFSSSAIGCGDTLILLYIHNIYHYLKTYNHAFYTIYSAFFLYISCQFGISL